MSGPRGPFTSELRLQKIFNLMQSRPVRTCRHYDSNTFWRDWQINHVGSIVYGQVMDDVFKFAATFKDYPSALQPAEL